jgi:Uma2 family endonuclease
MAAPQEKLLFTIEEYLEFERAAEERHEYIDGHIYKLSGESLEHSTINTNIIGELRSQLRGKPCRVLSPNMKIRSGPFFKEQKTRKGLFSYADVSVVCEEPRFHDQHRDVLLNPTVIIEILSASTEEYDRDEKFRRYRTHIETLQDYALVSQTIPWIRLYSRHHQGWLFTDAAGLEEAIYLPSIDCRLLLAEVFDRVAFPPEEIEPDDETAIGSAS